MKIYQHGQLIENTNTAPRRSRLKRNRVGSNQFATKRKSDWKKIFFGFMGLVFTLTLIVQGIKTQLAPKFVSPLPADVTFEKMQSQSFIKKVDAETKTKATPTPTVSELESIVAYIARRFEPEGKDVVVRAINCFYSESGLRSHAVGQNSDEHHSKDHGVAQLNDYWHKLTPAQKTDIKANIDKAYEIYKGRGKNFSAWYGRLCN